MSASDLCRSKLVAEFAEHNENLKVTKMKKLNQCNLAFFPHVKNKVILLATMLIAFTSYSQTSYLQFKNSIIEKELIVGFGLTQFQGDLGGRNQIGKDYSLADIDMRATSIGGLIGFRYRFHRFWSTSFACNVGLLKGDDAYTDEVIRNSRNLHFRSIIVDASARLEFIVLATNKQKRNKVKKRLYVFSGIGIAYFNPKAKYLDSWVALRPLSTEGQGMPGGVEKTKPVSATIPLGIGFTVGIGKKWKIGFEGSYIKTFTDYIDDVSTNYYDPNVLGSQVGSDAAYLSNPAKKNATWFAPGQQRGSEQNDAYFFANIIVSRTLGNRYWNKRDVTHHQFNGKRIKN